MSALPPFTDEGLLPVGDYELSLAELMQSPLVHGPSEPRFSATWDASWRGKLVNNLSILVGQLWQVGVTEIFVDGSFAEDKDHPNDIDGYFECDLMRLATGELTHELNRLDPYEIWTWDPTARRRYRGYPKKQLPMWHRYRVEFYPHYGQQTGIRDRYGNKLEFPSAFRQSRRDGKAKGLIKIRR